MAQLENIEAIERRLWTAADTLRANSQYAGNEYFLPVMGLIFLRHAYSRFLEQLRNLIAIVWLYRGQADRFRELVSEYLRQTLEEARACFAPPSLIPHPSPRPVPSAPSSTRWKPSWAR